MARGKKVPPHDVLGMEIDGKFVAFCEIKDGEFRYCMPKEEWEKQAQRIAEGAVRRAEPALSYYHNLRHAGREAG